MNKMYRILTSVCLCFVLQEILSLTFDTDCRKKGTDDHQIFKCSRVKLELEKDKALKVRCTDITALADLNFEFDIIKEVQFENCSISNDFNVLLEKWKLNKINEFLLDKVILYGGIISKKTFKNLNKTLVKIFQVRRSKITDIEEGFFDGFDNLAVLDLCENELRELKSDIFKNLPKLEVVYLMKNDIGMLPKFITAPNLRILHLNQNKLRTLHSEVFNKSANLCSLELTDNDLETLPEDVLHPLKQLEDVSFTFNQVNFNITKEFLKKNINLKSLKFFNGNLSIEPGAFDNLTNLRNLIIHGSRIKSLPAGVFGNVKKLKILKLSANEIETLPDDVFANLHLLENLDLSENKLKQWKREYYKNGFVKLKKILLNNNDLEEIPASSFQNVRKLETLILGHNKIRNIHKNAFDEESPISYLDVSFNQLTNSYLNLSIFDEYEEISPYTSLTDLEIILLNNNFYTEIPSFTDGYITINLENNNISFLGDREILHILNYDSVNLSGNQIKKINFGYLKNVLDETEDEVHSLKIYLNNNPLVCDCFSYDLVSFLQNKYDVTVQRSLRIIADEAICSNPVEFRGLSVKNLLLSDLNCDVTETMGNYKCPENCSCSVRPASQSLEIDCSNLGLKTMPNIDAFVSSVFDEEYIRVTVSNYILNLNNNNISVFHKQPNYTDLTNLNISSNGLTEILWLPPNIKILGLDNNNLSFLNDSIVSFLSNSTLSRLTINNNPWKCDCSLKYFADAVRSKLLNSIDETVHCKDGRDLIILIESELCKNDDVIVTVLYGLLVIVLVTISIILILFHKCEQEIKAWLYSNNIFLYYVTDEELDKSKEYDAFVSYSHKDEDFIAKHLVPELESDENPYKLCIHVRDWVVGELISKQIINSIKNSRRTIIVLSKNFLESCWATMEFRTAHMQMMEEKINRLIVILYDDIDIAHIEDEELKHYLKTNTYVKWGDRWFWKKLKYALPHKKQEKGNKAIRNVRIPIDEEINLALIPAASITAIESRTVLVENDSTATEIVPEERVCGS